MKKVCTPIELGLTQVPGASTRYRDDSGCEVLVWLDPVGKGLHVDPSRPSYLDGKYSFNTLQVVSACIRKAKSLGYDAWMCDNNPINGGWINAREDVCEKPA